MVLIEQREDMHDYRQLHKELSEASDDPRSYQRPFLDILIDIRTALNRIASSLENHSTQTYRIISALEFQCDALKDISSVYTAVSAPELEKGARRKVEKITAEQAFKKRREKRIAEGSQRVTSN